MKALQHAWTAWGNVGVLSGRRIRFFLCLGMIALSSAAARATDTLYSADTIQWRTENWYGATTATRTNFDGRSCLRVTAAATNGAGVIRTECFPAENWESPVTGLRADVYIAAGSAGMKLKLQPVNASAQDVETVTLDAGSSGAWVTYTWTFTGAANYTQVSQLRVLFDSIATGQAVFYVDNLRLVTGSGEVPWEDFDGAPMDWAITAEDVPYDDAVRFNNNGWNEKATRIDRGAGSIGSLYLGWDSSLSEANYAKVFNKDPLNQDWSGYGAIRLHLKSSTTNTKVFVGIVQGSDYLETVALPVATAGEWIVCEWPLPGAASARTNVQQVALHARTDAGGTGTVLFDEIQLIAAGPGAWQDADTRTWLKEDWGGTTDLDRVTFQGRTCLKVTAGGGTAFFRTETFPAESWESPITAVRAEVFLATTNPSAKGKFEPQDAGGATIEGLLSGTIPQGTWSTITWDLSDEEDYSAVSKLILAFEQLGTNGAVVYVDNLRLVTAAGDVPWEDFSGVPLRWTVTWDQSTGYDDAVDYNTNGVNDSIARGGANGSIGALYLPWSAEASGGDFAKLITADEIDEDWSGKAGLRVRARSSVAGVQLQVSFMDDQSRFVATKAAELAQSNTWYEFAWDLPRGEFDWGAVRRVEPVAINAGSGSGYVLLDDLEVLDPDPVRVTSWVLGLDNGSGEEFLQGGATNRYRIEDLCVQAFERFPDRLSDTNGSITIEHRLRGSRAMRDSRLTVAACPSATQGPVHVDVFSAGTFVGTLYLHPAGGVLSDAVLVPAATLTGDTNELNVLELVKVGSGSSLFFDHIELSRVYAETSLFEAVAADALLDVDQGYSREIHEPLWGPVQNIHYSSFGLIRNFGIEWEEDHTPLLMYANDHDGWMLLQRPTAQYHDYRLDIFRRELGSHYRMKVYDLDDWDWSLAEWNETQRGCTADCLDHTQIPEWSQYISNVEVLDEIPTGSANWPWGCAVRGMGYFKLTSARASHASSPRTPFVNPFGIECPDCEDQSRMPQAYFETRSETALVVTARSDCRDLIGAVEATIGNFHTPELGYHSVSRIRLKTYLRRAFDVSEHDSRLAIGGIATMFWKDEYDTPGLEGDEAHDNDLVMVARADGTFSTHKLGQFPAEWATTYTHGNVPPSYADPAPVEFNIGSVGPGDTLYILQQDRDRDHYWRANVNEDYSPQFQNRGSFAYKVLASNRRLVAKIYEGVCYMDTWDNVVVSLEVAPDEEDLEIGDVVEVDYELTAFVNPGVFFTTADGGCINKRIDSAITLRWEGHHPEETPTNVVDTIRLQCSSNGLAWIDIATNAPNTGEYTWDISALPAGDYWFRIFGTATDGMQGWDVTDRQVKIVDVDSQAGLYMTGPTNEVLNYQYGGFAELLWNPAPTSGSGHADFVTIQYSPDLTNWVDIAIGATNTGYYKWNYVGALQTTVWLRVYGLAQDGTTRHDVWDVPVVVTNYQGLPISIGINDDRDREFNQYASTYSTNVYDANRDFPGTFPKELNTDFWDTQDFAFDLDEDTAFGGLTIIFDVMWNNGDGHLNVELSTDTGSGFQSVGTYPMKRGENPVIIASNYLAEGRITIRMQAVGGTDGTTVLTWDHIGMIGLQDQSQLTLGVNDGSANEFMQPWEGDYSALFDATAQTEAKFPQEVNLSWWTNQDIRIYLRESSATNGLSLVLDTGWTDGSGALLVDVYVQGTGDFAYVGTVFAKGGTDSQIAIGPQFLAAGYNTIRLRADSGTLGTSVAVWDQLYLRPLALVDQSNLSLGSDNGNSWEFLADGELFAPQFDATWQTVAAFPQELNQSWWTWQELTFYLSSTSAAQGVTLSLDTGWTDGSGTLRTEVRANGTTVGYVHLKGGVVSTIHILPEHLHAGLNVLRLQVVAGTFTTGIAVWDRISLAPLVYANQSALTLGSDNDSALEFLSQGSFYEHVFDATWMGAAQFPQELNVTWWTWQDIRVHLDAASATGGLTFVMDPGWTDGAGVLDVEVLVSSGGDYVSLGTVSLFRDVEAAVNIPAEYLAAGINTIRMAVQSGTYGTTTVVWDQLYLRPLIPRVHLVLGEDDGSASEFASSGGEALFDADTMSASQFPASLNATTWTSQTIRFVADAGALRNGLKLMLDAASSDGSGTLDVDVTLDNGLAAYAIEQAGVSATQPGVAWFPPAMLQVGTNRIVLAARTNASGTTSVSWDQVVLVEAIPLTRIVLGRDDGSEAEFASSNYVGVFDTDTMPASRFPKELNTSWWAYEFIDFTAYADALANGLQLTLDPMWADGTGHLQIEAAVEWGEGPHIAGSLSVNGSTKGYLTIPPSLLALGWNTLRLVVTNGTSGTSVAVWDQVTLAARKEVVVAYLAPNAYDEYGIPVWNLGDTMQYELHVFNLGAQALTGLTIAAVQEYYETTTNAAKGTALPSGDATQVWSGVSIPAGQNVVLSDSFLIPTNSLPGYNQTHVTIQDASQTIFEDDEAGVWCPPPLWAGDCLVAGLRVVTTGNERGSRDERAMSVEITLPDGVSASDVRRNSVQLEGVRPSSLKAAAGNVLNARFDRRKVLQHLPTGEQVPVLLRGELRDGRCFAGKDLVHTQEPKQRSVRGRASQRHTLLLSE